MFTQSRNHALSQQYCPCQASLEIVNTSSNSGHGYIYLNCLSTVHPSMIVLLLDNYNDNVGRVIAINW